MRRQVTQAARTGEDLASSFSTSSLTSSVCGNQRGNVNQPCPPSLSTPPLPVCLIHAVIIVGRVGGRS